MARREVRRAAGMGRLQRLVQALREREWSAIAIDFIIVVVGVFLGLQVDNWNQDRNDRSRAQAYLLRLHNDLASGIEAQAASTAFVTQASRYADQALAHAEQGRLVDGSAWMTVVAYYQAGQVYPYRISDATFREMSSTGDLRLLDDPRLSAAVGEFYLSHADSDTRLFRQLPAYRETIRQIVPSAVQRHIWDHCYRQISIARQEMVDCPPPVPEREAGAVLQAIRAQPRTLGELRYWSTQMRIELNVIEAERRSARDLLAAVDRARN